MKKITGLKSIHRLTSYGGDWEGIYVNGVLVMENHSIRARELAEFLGREYGIKVTSEEKSDEWFEEQGGRCPDEQPMH